MVLSPEGARLFSSRPTLGSTKPQIQWVLSVTSPEVKLTTHLPLVPRLRTHGVVPPPIRHGLIIKHRDIIFLSRCLSS
jgi:hypothetical protein